MDAKQYNAPNRDPGDEAILLEVSCGCGWRYQFEHALLAKEIAQQDLAGLLRFAESQSLDRPVAVTASEDEVLPQDALRTA